MKRHLPEKKYVQLKLFKSLKHAEIGGVAMGVLEDGTPYLTERGLAKLCGITHGVLQRLSAGWTKTSDKPRDSRITELLSAQGYGGNQLYIDIDEEGKRIHAYTDHVCMALLEYYAFDSDRGSNETALTNYRILARQTLRTFIYNKVGYDPKNLIPESWRHYHDRVTLNDLPVGYFSVFREIADVVIYAIQQGMKVDTQTVPDISVGIHWSKYWKGIDGDVKYGHRQKWPHAYPEYFPQSKSNPQDIFVYPLAALGEFRMWMQNEYLPTNFSGYLRNKVKQGALPASSVELLLEVVEQRPKMIAN